MQYDEREPRDEHGPGHTHRSERHDPGNVHFGPGEFGPRWAEGGPSRYWLQPRR